jgi:hypothetical protein
MPRWKIDTPLYSPVVAYIILTACFAVVVWMFARIFVLVPVVLYSLLIAWPLGFPRPDGFRVAEGDWLKWLCLGISAATVWIRRWAWPDRGR